MKIKGQKFAKETTRRRIKGLLEEFIGGRRKSITPNHIMGQMRSAVKHGILDIRECQKLVDDIQREIETNELFPSLSQREKFGRLSLIKDKLNKVEN